MDLSIVLLKYNRMEWLIGRVLSLSSFFQSTSLEYELIISDNHSSIPVSEILNQRTAKDYPYKIIMPETHLDTVEEHFRFVLGECKGDYVWVVGDDDPPNVLGLQQLEQKIQSKDAHLMIFDSNRHYLEGSVDNGTLLVSESQNVQHLEEFVKICGFWFTLAGISNLVFRKPTSVELKRLDELIEISPIYAHVIWLLITYWGKSFSFVPIPLVTYSEGQRDTSVSDHWELFSSKRNVYRNYWWTIGFIHLCEYLMQAKDLPYQWFMDIMEVNWRGIRRRPLLESIAQLLWEEITVSRVNARGIAQEEVEEVIGFLVQCNPKYEFMYSCFAKYGFVPTMIIAHRSEVDVFINDIVQKPLFDFFIGRYHDYSIFKLHNRYLAVSNHTLLAQPSHCFDGSLGDYLSSFSFSSLEALKKWVDEHQTIFNIQDERMILKPEPQYSDERLVQKAEEIMHSIHLMNATISKLTEIYQNRGFIKRCKFILRTILPKGLVRFLKKKRQALD